MKTTKKIKTKISHVFSVYTYIAYSTPVKHIFTLCFHEILATGYKGIVIVNFLFKIKMFYDYDYQ